MGTQMEQLLEYRQRLLDRYEAAAREFREAVRVADIPTISRDADGWSVHQIAVHTRDVQEMVYGLRVWRTLEEDDPLFENFDGDAHLAAHYNPQEPLASILDGLVDSVRATAARLRELPPEAWTRPSRHETYGGGFTAQAWLERCLAHIEEHLKTVNENLAI